MIEKIEYEDEEKTTYVAARHPFWGRGDTPEKAVHEYYQAGGLKRLTPKIAEVKWSPYKGETGGPYVDDFGALRVPGKFNADVVEVKLKPRPKKQRNMRNPKPRPKKQRNMRNPR